MSNTRKIALVVAGLITVAALMLVVDRGGLIAWSTSITGVALLIKLWLKPSRLDSALSVGLAAAAVLAWIGTYYYVISTWESGEVVELAIPTGGGTHTARVWVLELGAHPLVYYDAEPEVAKSLLAGEPLQLTRAGETSTRIPRATQVDELAEEDANRIFESMVRKYGDRLAAADVYYLLLGRSRDRIGVVVELVEA